MADFDRFPEIIARLDAAAQEGAREGAKLVEDSAKQRVPRVTGKLQRAIHVEEGVEGAYVIAGDKDVFYGHMVEHGTRHSPAHPFLLPALEEHRDEINALIAAHIERAIR